MKGVIAFLIVVALTLTAGFITQADLNKTVKEGIQLLSDANTYCSEGKYELSMASSEHFCALWDRKVPHYAYLYKYDLFDEISGATHKFEPLLTERNLSEYRALCTETIYYLQVLQSYECFSVSGVM